MKLTALYGLAAAALVSATLAAAPAHAQATRTWVSGTGDDANPCSRTAPCKTFAGAISKTAAGGEIDALDPGGYGSITITKAITLDGGGQVASLLFSNTAGVNVNAGPNDVVILRNLRMNGISQSSSPGTFGINFINGAALVVENCDIFDTGNWAINFAPNPLTAPTAPNQLHVVNSVISNAGIGTTGGGILVQPGANGNAKASIANVKVTNSAVGIRVDGSNTTNQTFMSISDTVSSGSPHSGAVAFTTNGPVSMTINHLTSTANNVGVQAVGNSTVLLGNSEISGNTTGTATVNGGSILSYKNNQINGNNNDGALLPAVQTN